MNRHAMIGLVVLGVCVQANAGSAETPGPSALDVTRPAFLAATTEAPAAPVLAYAGADDGSFAVPPPGATM